MFGRGGDTYKRKTKIKRDVGSSDDEGGQVHERTKIKQKRRNVRGNFMADQGSHLMGTGTNVIPVTTTTTGMRGRHHMRNQSSSSSSSSDNRQRNIGTTNVNPVGFNTGTTTTGYNQTYQPTTMTNPMSGPQLDNFNQTTSKKVSKPGFVEKMRYKLRSRR